MTSPNTIIANLVDDRNRLSVALHRVAFEAASYADCVEIAKNAISAGILPYPPVKYGCHCDLEEGAHPDGCLIDENKPHFCIFAEDLLQKGKGRNDCEYWRPIPMDHNKRIAVSSSVTKDHHE